MSTSGSGTPDFGGGNNPGQVTESSTSPASVQQLVDSLSTHRVNTLTELCRIERQAILLCDNEANARALQAPLTLAWNHYVSHNQLLAELRGLSSGYPFSGDVVRDARALVLADPQACQRSWNMAWLCLVRIQQDGMVAAYAALEARKPEMWGGQQPTDEELARLTAHFEEAWTLAVHTMLRHWTRAPTWY